MASKRASGTFDEKQKSDLLDWVNEMLWPIMKISNFLDLRNVDIIIILLNNMRHNVLPESETKGNNFVKWKRALYAAQNYFGLRADFTWAKCAQGMEEIKYIQYVSYFLEPFIKEILHWVNFKLPTIQQAKNFGEDWQDGNKLASLIETIAPGFIPIGFDSGDSVQGQHLLAKVHRVFHITCPYRYEDILSGNFESAIMAAYINRFRHITYPYSTEELLLWFNCMICPLRVDNLTTCLSHGVALKYLLNVMSGNERKVEHTECTDDSCKEVIDAAAKLGINADNFTPQELAEGRVDEFRMRQYLSQYRDVFMQNNETVAQETVRGLGAALEERGIKLSGHTPSHDGKNRMLLNAVKEKYLFSFPIKNETIRNLNKDACITTTFLYRLNSAQKLTPILREQSEKSYSLDWVNAMLWPRKRISNFDVDWKSGDTIIVLLNNMSPGLFPESKVIENNTEKWERVLNTVRNNFGVKEDFTGAECSRGLEERKYIKYVKSILEPFNKEVLDWVNSKLSVRLQTKNFGEDWQNGRKLVVLIETIAPGFIPKEFDSGDSVQGQDLLTKVHRVFHITCPYRYEDILSGNFESAIMAAYINRFRHITYPYSTKELLLWFNCMICPLRVDNLTTCLSHGVALKYLLNAMSGNERKVVHTECTDDSCKEVIDTAAKLGINADNFTPQELAEGRVEEFRMRQYLSQYRDVFMQNNEVVAQEAVRGLGAALEERGIKLSRHTSSHEEKNRMLLNAVKGKYLFSFPVDNAILYRLDEDACITTTLLYRLSYAPNRITILSPIISDITSKDPRESPAMELEDKESYLLDWVNEMLWPRKNISNFDEDWKSADTFVILLNNITPNLLPESELTVNNVEKWDRALIAAENNFGLKADFIGADCSRGMEKSKYIKYVSSFLEPFNKEVLDWVNSKLSVRLQTKNFGEDWQNGRRLVVLIETIAPGFIPKEFDSGDSVRGQNLLAKVHRVFHITCPYRYEDILSGNFEPAIMAAYINRFRHITYPYSTKELLLWFNCMICPLRVDNLTTCLSHGVALKYLLNAMSGNERKVVHTECTDDSCKEVIDTAAKLGINADNFTPQELAEGGVEEFRMRQYLSKYRDVFMQNNEAGAQEAVKGLGAALEERGIKLSGQTSSHEEKNRMLLNSVKEKYLFSFPVDNATVYKLDEDACITTTLLYRLSYAPNRITILSPIISDITSKDPRESPAMELEDKESYLLDWVNEMLWPRMNISNFDEDWKSADTFVILLNNITPNLLPESELTVNNIEKWDRALIAAENNFGLKADFIGADYSRGMEKNKFIKYVSSFLEPFNKEVLDWVNSKLSVRLQTKNFGEDWQNGRRLVVLIETIAPGFIPKEFDLGDSVQGQELLAKVHRVFHITCPFRYEDILSGNFESAIMAAYINRFRHITYPYSTEELLLWFNCLICPLRVDNLTTSLSHGVALKYLLNAMSGNERKVVHTECTDDSCKEVIDTAAKLGINADNFTPQELAEGRVEEFRMRQYLSQYRDVFMQNNEVVAQEAVRGLGAALEERGIKLSRHTSSHEEKNRMLLNSVKEKYLFSFPVDNAILYRLDEDACITTTLLYRLSYAPNRITILSPIISDITSKDPRESPAMELEDKESYLLDWVNEMLWPRKNISNFDEDWKSADTFVILLNNITPNLLPESELTVNNIEKWDRALIAAENNFGLKADFIGADCSRGMEKSKYIKYVSSFLEPFNKEVLDWVNSKLSVRLQTKNFGEDWQNGRRLVVLIETIAPGFIPKEFDSGDSVRGQNLLAKVHRVFHITCPYRYEDILSGNFESAIMAAYINRFRYITLPYITEELLLWFNCLICPLRVDNLTTSLSHGVALKYLLNAMSGNERKVVHTECTDDSCKDVIDTAAKLGINADNFTPQELAEGRVEEFRMRQYLSQYRDVFMQNNEVVAQEAVRGLGAALEERGIKLSGQTSSHEEKNRMLLNSVKEKYLFSFPADDAIFYSLDEDACIATSFLFKINSTLSTCS